MIKSVVIGVLFLPFFVFAQQGAVRVDKPVICFDSKTTIEELQKEWKEIPFWGSVLEDKSKIALFINPKTKSWTILQWNDKVACVIEAGEDYVVTGVGI